MKKDKIAGTIGLALLLAGCSKAPPPTNPYIELDRRLAAIEAAVETGARVDQLRELIASARAEAKLTPLAADAVADFSTMDGCLRIISDSNVLASRRLLNRARLGIGTKPSDQDLETWQKQSARYDEALKTILETPKHLRALTAQRYADMARGK